MPQEYVLELVHTGICEKQGRVILRNEAGTGDNGMTALLEKFEEFCPDFFACHLFSRRIDIKTDQGSKFIINLNLPEP